MMPSPQLAAQAPAELAAYPVATQVRQTLADLQVLQLLEHATHPLEVSKYWPEGQSIGFRIDFSHTPKLPL
jgi:hypothetical protein